MDSEADRQDFTYTNMGSSDKQSAKETKQGEISHHHTVSRVQLRILPASLVMLNILLFV